jgi:hypothetical protein
VQGIEMRLTPRSYIRKVRYKAQQIPEYFWLRKLGVCKV